MHCLGVKVYMEDVDAQGIVYHANYLRFVERGRTEALASLGEPLHQAQAAGRLYVVHEMHLRFRRPARLGDELEVRTTWERASAYRVSFTQEIFRGAERTALFGAEVQVVCVDPEGKLLELPVELFED